MKSPDPNSNRSARKEVRGIQTHSPDLSGRIHKRASKRGANGQTFLIRGNSVTPGPGESVQSPQSGHKMNSGGKYEYY